MKKQKYILAREVKILKDYKKDNHLTLKELSEKTGIAGAQLSSWMTGRIKPNSESLQNINLFLKNAYSVDDLEKIRAELSNLIKITDYMK